jgi:hypothetical protein
MLAILFNETLYVFGTCEDVDQHKIMEYFLKLIMKFNKDNLQGQEHNWWALVGEAQAW